MPQRIPPGHYLSTHSSPRSLATLRAMRSAEACALIRRQVRILRRRLNATGNCSIARESLENLRRQIDSLAIAPIRFTASGDFTTELQARRCHGGFFVIEEYFN